MRIGKFVLTAFLLAAFLASGSSALAQEAPQFKLGFKALADQIPGIAGQPMEDEHWGANGDSLQQTTTGLMVWRKADNWTAFTTGSITWINGPGGLVSRRNDQRFEWEQDTSPAQPAAMPAPAPGLILFAADWSGGMGGWPEAAGWSAVDGMLVNGGSSSDTTIVAPYRPELSNYAVEAEIEVVSPFWQRRAFALVARDAYRGGLNWWSYMDTRHPYVGTRSQTLAQTEFNPGGDWHKYRLEVDGGHVRLSIDGTVRAEATGQSSLSPGGVGIWDGGVQIRVRSFRVIAL